MKPSKEGRGEDGSILWRVWRSRLVCAGLFCEELWTVLWRIQEPCLVPNRKWETYIPQVAEAMTGCLRADTRHGSCKRDTWPLHPTYDLLPPPK